RTIGASPGTQLAADAEAFVDQDDAVLGALVGGAGRAHRDAGRLVAMQAGFREMHGPRPGALALLEGMDAVEPHPPGAIAIGVEIRQRRHVAAGVPFLAGGGAGVAADAQIEVDNEPEFFLAGMRPRQIGHAASPGWRSPPPGPLSAAP